MYIAKKNKADRWEKPSYFKELNVSEDDGVCSFTADGKTIFFTRSMAEGEHRGGTSIMTSTRSGGEWTEPRIVTIFKDSTIMVGHPAISPDGQSLYFVSDYRGQSFGGKDIFVCQKIGGSWSVPENLGDRINTTGNEMFPYVATDGTLYFASDGTSGVRRTRYLQCPKRQYRTVGSTKYACSDELAKRRFRHNVQRRRGKRIFFFEQRKHQECGQHILV